MKITDDMLPELPDPARSYADHSDRAFSKQQMTDYARDAIAHWVKQNLPFFGDSADAPLDHVSEKGRAGEEAVRIAKSGFDPSAQYDENDVHIGSGLPKATCPCGLCEKMRGLKEKRHG